MKRVKGLLIAALAVFGASTASYANPCEDIDRVRQLESLRSVYYRGGALPPDPSETELASLRELKAETNLQEHATFLEDAFPGNEKLQAIAIRDHDRDGVRDYRITKCGEFRENDPDSDCDRVANVLDDSPYDSTATPGTKTCEGEPDWHEITNDHNANGLPDQIDWRVLDASSSARKRPAEVQEGLYRDYKIVLVDRRTRMPAAMAVDLDRIIRDIFRDQILPDFPPLRVIATDISVCGDGDTYGWASPESSTVHVMRDTTTLSPILRLEVLVHEIRHTLQYARDFTAADLLGFRTRNAFDSDGFHAYARSLEWRADPKPDAQSRAPYRLAVWNCDDDETDYPFDLFYLDREAKDWISDWGRFTSSQRKAHHMVDEYAFTSAWEWDAEYTAAFVLNQITRAASRVCTPNQARVLRRRLRNDIANAWDYYHENARGLDSYENVIASQFHVDDATWDALARRFLLGSYPRVCRG